MKNAAEFNNSAAFFMLVMHGQGLRNYLQKIFAAPYRLMILFVKGLMRTLRIIQLNVINATYNRMIMNMEMTIFREPEDSGIRKI